MLPRTLTPATAESPDPAPDDLGRGPVTAPLDGDPLTAALAAQAVATETLARIADALASIAVNGERIANALESYAAHHAG